MAPPGRPAQVRVYYDGLDAHKDPGCKAGLPGYKHRRRALDSGGPFVRLNTGISPVLALKCTTCWKSSIRSK
jgi:hypothetical protein